MHFVEIIHNAARQYCLAQSEIWTQRYGELGARGGDRTKTGYTDEARNTFPRYNVLGAILREVERFVPADFTSEAEARALISLAGETAESPFTDDENPISRAAITDERHKFCQFVNTADVKEMESAPLLPFRRALTDAEHRTLLQKFNTIWGKWYGGCADSNPRELETVTLYIAAMDDSTTYDAVRDLILHRGISRILELRESGGGYELPTEDTTFTYNGAEGFWTSGEMSWMVQASHECSITFGGLWLVEGMRQRIRNFEHWIYKGWDPQLYGDPPK